MVEIFGYKFFEDEAPKQVVKKITAKPVSPKIEKIVKLPEKKKIQNRPTPLTELQNRQAGRNTINEIVDWHIQVENTAQFQSLVNASWFQKEFFAVIDKPSKTPYDIVVIQLQGKIKYGLAIDVDAIGGPQCDAVVALWKQKQEVASLKNSIESNYQAIFSHLETIVQSKDKAKIEQDLSNNAGLYRWLVNSSWFQSKLNQSLINPEKNALVLQLYARFVLQDSSVLVDGIYGNQTKSIVEKYTGEAEEKARTERRKNRLTTEAEPVNKQQTITQKASELFMEKSLNSYDNSLCMKKFALPEATLKSLLSNKERKIKDPTKIAALCAQKQNILFKNTIKSWVNGCINYLQKLFQKPITIDGKTEDLEKIFQSDPNTGMTSRDQSIEFKATIQGKEYPIVYNMLQWTLTYAPVFSMDPKMWDLLKWKSWLDKPLIDTKVPSLLEMIQTANTSIVSAAQVKNNNRPWIMNSIRWLQVPPINVSTSQESLAKTIQKESCIQQFIKLTGYELPHDLWKSAYENTQIYKLYDLLNHTLNAQKTSWEIGHFRNLLQRLSSVVDVYQDPSKPMHQNLRKSQFAIENIATQKSDLLSPVAGTSAEKSLTFYNLFAQYINPGLSSTDLNYNVLDIHKIESDLAVYDARGILPDDNLRGTIAYNVQKSDIQEADDMLKNLS